MLSGIGREGGGRIWEVLETVLGEKKRKWVDDDDGGIASISWAGLGWAGLG